MEFVSVASPQSNRQRRVSLLVDHTSERREAVLNGPVLLPASAFYRVKSPKICNLYGCL